MFFLQQMKLASFKSKCRWLYFLNINSESFTFTGKQIECQNIAKHMTHYWWKNTVLLCKYNCGLWAWHSRVIDRSSGRFHATHSHCHKMTSLFSLSYQCANKRWVHNVLAKPTPKPIDVTKCIVRLFVVQPSQLWYKCIEWSEIQAH